MLYVQDEDSNDEENLDQNLKADTFVEEDLTNENLDDDSNKDEDSLNNILFDRDNYDSSNNNKAVRTEGILGAINDRPSQPTLKSFPRDKNDRCFRSIWYSKFCWL